MLCKTFHCGCVILGDEYSRLSGAPAGSSYNNQPGYAEAGEAPKASMSFNDASIRAAFVRKVFFLVTIMVCFLLYLLFVFIISNLF